MIERKQFWWLSTSRTLRFSTYSIAWYWWWKVDASIKVQLIKASITLTEWDSLVLLSVIHLTTSCQSCITSHQSISLTIPNILKLMMPSLHLLSPKKSRTKIIMKFKKGKKKFLSARNWVPSSKEMWSTLWEILLSLKLELCRLFSWDSLWEGFILAQMKELITL